MCRLLKVSGQSLFPDFEDGDFVLVSKVPILFRSLLPGEVVAFRHPDYGMMIKKIDSISPNGKELTLIGSHPSSVDSRQFGPVHRETVIGKVILHIHKTR